MRVTIVVFLLALPACGGAPGAPAQAAAQPLEEGDAGVVTCYHCGHVGDADEAAFAEAVLLEQEACIRYVEKFCSLECRVSTECPVDTLCALRECDTRPLDWLETSIDGYNCSADTLRCDGDSVAADCWPIHPYGMGLSVCVDE